MSTPSVTETVARQNAALQARLPFHDRQDFEAARRGLIAGLDPPRDRRRRAGRLGPRRVRASSQGDAPSTVNPSLWRQGAHGQHGLFEVVAGIYQVRGLDLSNMTFVEGDSGVIVIDPLISVETRRGRAGALPRAARRPARDRGDLHALARRPLRRGQGRDDAGRRGRRALPFSRPRLPRPRPSARTSTPAPRWPVAPATCTAPRCPRVPRARSAPGSGRPRRTGTVDADRPTADITRTGQEEWSTACASSSS